MTHSSGMTRLVTTCVLGRESGGGADTKGRSKGGRGGTARKAQKVQHLTDKALKRERSKQLLLEHLADFVHEHQQWLHGHFPTRDYLSNTGRIDLADSIRKLGGPAKVADMFGLKWGCPSAMAKSNRLDARAQQEGQQEGDGMKILDQQKLEEAIAENVEKGRAFMIEHTSSNTPMQENFWTLWKPPISAGSTQETVSVILEESHKCSRHNPRCYVRITAFDNGNLSRKITFTIHKPLSESYQ